MKHSKMIPDYTSEINRLAMDHAEALCSLYLNAFHDGVRAGKRNTLFAVGIAATVGIIGLCIAGVNYLERKEQL